MSSHPQQEHIAIGRYVLAHCAQDLQDETQQNNKALWAGDYVLPDTFRGNKVGIINPKSKHIWSKAKTIESIIRKVVSLAIGERVENIGGGTGVPSTVRSGSLLEDFMNENGLWATKENGKRMLNDLTAGNLGAHIYDQMPQEDEDEDEEVEIEIGDDEGIEMGDFVIVSDDVEAITEIPEWDDGDAGTLVMAATRIDNLNDAWQANRYHSKHGLTQRVVGGKDIKDSAKRSHIMAHYTKLRPVKGEPQQIAPVKICFVIQDGLMDCMGYKNVSKDDFIKSKMSDGGRPFLEQMGATVANALRETETNILHPSLANAISDDVKRGLLADNFKKQDDIDNIDHYIRSHTVAVVSADAIDADEYFDFDFQV